MKNIETICVQSGYQPKNGESRVLPIHQSTTFYYETPEQMANLFDLSEDGHIYSRISNPTVACLEAKLAELEGGSGALACSSGLAAETIAILTVCQAGDNILALSTIYGGSYNLFNVTLRKYGIETRFLSPNATAEEIQSKIDDRTKLLFCETVANPAMVVCDFDKLSAVCRKNGILFVVDNTLATPYLVKPLEHGANVVIHSTTKYMDGHATCVGGMIVDGGNFEFDSARYPDFTEPDESYHGLVYKDLKSTAYVTKARVQYMRDIGACMSPFNAFLTNLGTETLHVRMQRHSDNALKVAQMLQNHPQVEWVKYPGLQSDPQHALAAKYFRNGFSGMVVFGNKGGRQAAMEFQKSLKLMSVVTHIADVRSCCLHPASTTHRQLSDSDLKQAGVSDNLIRLSVGIENVEDILQDISQALDGVK